MVTPIATACRVPSMHLSGGLELRGSCWLYAYGLIPGKRTSWVFGLVVHGQAWRIKAGPLHRHQADMNPGSIGLKQSETCGPRRRSGYDLDLMEETEPTSCVSAALAMHLC